MTREEEIKHVFANKELILSKKKNAIKRGDNVLNVLKSEISKDDAEKANIDIQDMNSDVLKARLVINTTNVIDSHMDCHIPGLWTKTLAENKMLYLLQEHEMEFDKVISDSVNDSLIATAEKISWKALGQNFEGKTEALIFSTDIKKDINPFMFDLYKKGRVLNHSVGMRYMKIYLCVDSTDAYYAAEKDNWNKYYPQVANKEVADEKGYFWAVTEAKVIEGSAVVKGSNCYTPVMEITDKDEPSNDTQNTEPEASTQTVKRRRN